MKLAVVVLAACSSAAQPVAAPTPAAPQPAAPVVAAADLTALTEIDASDPGSVDRAVTAADAAGARRDVRAVGALGALATRPPEKPLIAAQVGAVRALGKIAAPAAVDALLAVVARELPPRPTDPATGETYTLALVATGAAINALAEQRDPRATPALVRAFYRVPELSSQLRRATALGPAAIAPFVEVLRGNRDDAIGKHVDQACDPQGSCRPLAARDFYAALVLGDLRATSAVPDLLVALARPALPIFVIDGEVSPTTQHEAIYDALRRIGSSEAAPALAKIWSDPKLPAHERALAAAAYPFVATGAADALWTIAADNTEPAELRSAAATAYARLARDPHHAAKLVALATTYLDASATKRARAAKALPKKRQADDMLAEHKDALERGKVKLLALANDPKSSIAEIKAGTAALKKAEAEYTTAKAKHRATTAPWRDADAAATADLGYARALETDVARIELASRCLDDATCYAAAIAIDASSVVRRVKSLMPGVEAWTEDQKQGLVEAYADRALLELAKRKATPQLDAVLAGLASENRYVREAILLALPHLAPSPCPACIAKLDAALEAGRGKPHLAASQIETEVVRNHLRAR